MSTPPPKDNPFASLNLPDLPPGPAVDPKSSKSLWKMGKVKLQRETAHRGGKTVIVIKDFATRSLGLRLRRHGEGQARGDSGRQRGENPCRARGRGL